jgi:pSer/pThr/pTyr-binding forkhead associated (FHA) protein
VSRTLSIDDGRLQREVMLVGTTLVGRDPECDISHADPRLSRRHAEFRVTPDGVRLRDLGSRNGTHVNGHIVDEVMLASGDVVQIAHLTIRFNDADTTVHMGRGSPAIVRGPVAVAQPVDDDRTRVVSPSGVSSLAAPTAVGIPMPLDDRTRLNRPAAVRQQQTPAPALARLTQTTESIPSSVVSDAGEVVLRERAMQAGRPISSPPDLSVFGLAGSHWGRQVLMQGLALGLLVLVLTGAPLIAWGQSNGASILSSWPVLLPVVVAAAGAGVAVASLIARTTARGLASQDK